jgi:autotransporter-associated beta strand protein
MKTTLDSMSHPLRAQLARALSRAFTIAPSASALALGLVFLYPTGASAQIVVTQNTEGTLVWECPPGVFSVQVECWGGGGGGGAADYTGTASSGTINVAGGGGAGGAYARTASVDVTPGIVYNLTIPAAAAGAPAGSADGVLGATGGTVTFTGDSASVTAVGGQGGASRASTTTATGAGGQGSTTGCVGEVVFAGGSSNVSLASGTAGGGGGGAGNANPGGNATNNVGGAGGVSGGGVGGTGPTGGNNGNSGNPKPGVAGGGSGGREQRTSTTGPYAGGAGGLGQITLTYTPPSTGKLVVTTVPGSATAGSDFSVTVQAQDSGGSPLNVTQDTSVSLAASGTGTLSGNTAIIPSGQNSVTLNSAQYTKAEAVTFTASRTSGDQLDTSVASASVTVDSAAASQIVFTTQPSASTPLNTPFATQPVVQIRDAFGNLVTTGGDATANVSLTLTTGTGTLGGTTSINAVGGVADFVGQGLNINQAGTDKVLTATATIGAGAVTAVTNPFTITATALAWSATPATFNWTTANEVNWTGGTGIYTDPGLSAVTFDDTGDATSPINVVGTLQPVSVTVNNSVNNFTFAGSGDISGSTGITKSGTGTLTVSNANSYSGSTFVNAGTLVMANPAALGNNTGLIRFPAGSTGTLRVSTDGSDTPYQIGANSGTADLVNDTWSTDFTIASDLATPGAGITHSLGELSLALARLNIVAGPNVSGGAPKITFASMLVTSASTNPPAKINPTTATVSIGNVTTLNNTAKTLILGGTNTGNEITGNIGTGPGTLAVTKTDSSTWTLSGANTYTGVTTVNGGTLLNGSSTTFANTGDLDVDGTGVLDLNGFNASFTNLTDDNDAGTITNSAVGSATITLANAADDDDHLKSAEFTGNLTLSIANSNSSASLAGLRTTNSFTGGIILRDGSGFTSTTVGTRLRIFTDITETPGTPFGSGPITIGESPTDKPGIMMDTVSNTISNAIVFNTALGTDVPGIRIQGTDQVLSGQISAALADATFCSGNTNSGTATLTGKITGPFGLAMTPAAVATTSALTLTLNNAAMDNDYAGDTTISKVGTSAYTLTLGTANQIPNGTGKGNVANDGTLDLNGFSETINGLAGTGVVDTIAGGTPVLTVGDNDQTSTFDGVIQNTAGTLALTKVGTGTLTLAGINTYTGNTTVNSGVLAVNGTSIDDTTTLIIDGGKVDVTGNETVAALFFGATPMADGVYGSTSSTAPAPNQDDTRFSGTGTVTVDSSLAPGGFSTWLANGGFANDALLVGNDGPNDDPDNDGISNLIEYALDGFDPTAPNAAPGSITGLLVTYTKRALAVTNGDVTYTIEESTDLGVSDLWAPATPTTDDASIITYTLTPPAPSKDFVRLKVTQP